MRWEIQLAHKCQDSEVISLKLVIVSNQHGIVEQT